MSKKAGKPTASTAMVSKTAAKSSTTKQLHVTRKRVLHVWYEKNDKGAWSLKQRFEDA